MWMCISGCHTSCVLKRRLGMCTSNLQDKIEIEDADALQQFLLCDLSLKNKMKCRTFIQDKESLTITH